MRLRTALGLSAIALSLATASPCSAAAARTRAHRSTGGDQDCISCHRGVTEAAVKAWEGSPHGTFGVKCLICHGSTGKDFAARPAPARCGSCHARQVGTLAKSAKASCFDCHDPHSLSANPHR